MSDLPKPHEVAHWLEQARRDLDWLQNSSTGHTPYEWAYEALDGIRSYQYGVRVANEPQDPTGHRASEERVARLTTIAEKLHTAQQALKAVRNDLTANERNQPAGQGPRGRFIPKAEMEHLLAMQAKRNARARG